MRAPKLTAPILAAITFVALPAAGAAPDPIADESSKRLAPGFRHIPCPWRKGRSAVALPDGSCLALAPSPKPFAYATADRDDPRDICPVPTRLRRRGGRTVAETLRTPGHSFLLSPEHCCDEIDLAVDPSGRISAEPRDNPPEGCLFGHRTGAMQDIFRLDRGRLRLVGQLSAPWFP